MELFFYFCAYIESQTSESLKAMCRLDTPLEALLAQVGSRIDC